MTDLAVQPSGGALARPRSAPVAPKAQQVRESLQNVRARLLKPFIEWDRIRGSFNEPGMPAAWQAARYADFLSFGWPRTDHPETEEHRELLVASVDRILAGFPSLDDLQAVAALMRTALDTKPNDGVTRMCVGLMVDGFPNARPHSPEAYLETIIDLVQGESFPPAAVGKACHDIIRTATFAPAPAEVLEKASEARDRLRSGVMQVERHHLNVDYLHRLRAWLESVPLLIRGPDSNYQHGPARPDHANYSSRFTA